MSGIVSHRKVEVPFLGLIRVFAALFFRQIHRKEGKKRRYAPLRPGVFFYPSVNENKAGMVKGRPSNRDRQKAQGSLPGETVSLSSKRRLALTRTGLHHLEMRV